MRTLSQKSDKKPDVFALKAGNVRFYVVIYFNGNMETKFNLSAPFNHQF